MGDQLTNNHSGKNKKNYLAKLMRVTCGIFSKFDFLVSSIARYLFIPNTFNLTRKAE